MEMVWCQSCKTVVWAYDHAKPSDRASVANGFMLPCPLCGEKGNFNGRSISFHQHLMALKEKAEVEGHKIYDTWSLMKYLANQQELRWNPSGDNSWFRPATTLTLPEPLRPIVRY